MNQIKNQKHILLESDNLYKYAISKFLPTSGFKWTDLKELNKFTSTSSKGSLLKVDLKYLKELHNDYPLASDKVEIK